MGSVNLGQVRDKITSIRRTSGNGEAGTTDTYTVYTECSPGGAGTFDVYNGANGASGADGADGADGRDGVDGAIKNVGTLTDNGPGQDWYRAVNSAISDMTEEQIMATTFYGTIYPGGGYIAHTKVLFKSLEKPTRIANTDRIYWYTYEGGSGIMFKLRGSVYVIKDGKLYNGASSSSGLQAAINQAFYGVDTEFGFDGYETVGLDSSRNYEVTVHNRLSTSYPQKIYASEKTRGPFFATRASSSDDWVIKYEKPIKVLGPYTSASSLVDGLKSEFSDQAKPILSMVSERAPTSGGGTIQIARQVMFSFGYPIGGASTSDQYVVLKVFDSTGALKDWSYSNDGSIYVYVDED